MRAAGPTTAAADAEEEGGDEEDEGDDEGEDEEEEEEEEEQRIDLFAAIDQDDIAMLQVCAACGGAGRACAGGRAGQPRGSGRGVGGKEGRG